MSRSDKKYDKLYRVYFLFTRVIRAESAMEAAFVLKKPRTGKVRGRINLQRKIGPYLLVVLADFELVFALALDSVNSLAP